MTRSSPRAGLFARVAVVALTLGSLAALTLLPVDALSGAESPRLLSLESVLGAQPAAAVPSTGPGDDTPGTSATVSPRSLRAGETIRFHITGFPGGEIVYVKIDDGKFCAESGVHGACVVHQQRIPASGTVSGSLVLPADLRPGNHWLRFLASEEVTGDDGSYEGIKGYTLRGDSDFVVVAASSPGSSTPAPSASSGTTPSAGPTDDLVDGDDPDQGSPVASPGTTLVATAQPGGQASEPVTTAPLTAPESAPAEASAAAISAAAASPQSAPAVADRADQRFPIVGVLGCLLLCVLAGLLVLRSRGGRE